MRRAVALVVAALAVVLAPAACTEEEAPKAVVFDGRARVPDVEGVVTEVSFESITLAGGETYRITRDLQCFSTYTGEPLPLLGRKGQYVQLALDGRTVRWLASVGSVVSGPPPSVYYTGDLVRVDDGRLVFEDGSVFRLGDGVPAPGPGFVQVEIDPGGRVRRLF